MGSLHFAPRSFTERIADLDFTVQLPADWIAHDLPQGETDFSDPTTLVPLAVVTAPHAAIVMAFAARPAYDDGSLHDWAYYLLGNSQLKPNAIGEGHVGNLAAIVGEGAQESEVGPLVIRFAFTEDGSRLINLTYTCPEALDSAVRDVWFQSLESFALARPRGSTAPLFPPVTAAPPAATEATNNETDAVEPEPETSTPSSSNGEPVIPNDGRPAWWHKALQLEAEGRLEEAEETIEKGAQHIGGAASVAQMYANRMVRLQQAGDTEGARQAFVKADQWIFYYASQATSGGEGAALSRERDQFRAQMLGLHAGDPRAQ